MYVLNIESAICNVTNCLPTTYNFKVPFSRKYYLAWPSRDKIPVFSPGNLIFPIFEKGQGRPPPAPLSNSSYVLAIKDIKLKITYGTQNSANDPLSWLIAKHFVTFLHDHITQIKLSILPHPHTKVSKTLQE